jgi:F-type H+-transporting ATPase subunit delta
MDNIAEYSIAESYGKALFDLSVEGGFVVDVHDDIAGVNSVFESQHDFKSFMENPCISIAKRKDAFEGVFKSRIGGLSSKFFGVLIGDGKVNCLSEILRQFEKLVDENNGVVAVNVTLSHELDEKGIDELKGKLSVACGSEVKMDVVVDPRILGGIIISRGDRVIDNSVSRAIERALREKV